MSLEDMKRELRERFEDIQRKRWIRRVFNDFNTVTYALDRIMREINPKWRILRCDIGGSLGEYLKGKTQMFKTPYGGISGAQLRGEEVSKEYVSDVDAVCWVTEETDMWHKGNLVMGAEMKIQREPEKYLPRYRGKECVNFMGNKIDSIHCNNPFWLPLDEYDLRRTHEVRMSITLSFIYLPSPKPAFRPHKAR